MAQSGRAAPGGAMAGRMSCTRRSVLVKVPSFSANPAAGSTTSARCAVSLGKRSCTTRKSTASSPSATWVRLGSDSMGFSPMTKMARMSPRSAPWMISVTVSPGLAPNVSKGTLQPAANLRRTASSATGW